MRRPANVALVTAIVLAGALAPVPASGQPSPAGTGANAGDQGAPHLWSFFTAASSVFESNIDRIPGGNQAEGLVVGLGGQYRNRVDRPAFMAQYQLGGHLYAGAPRWSRISHNARAAYERRLGRALTFDAVGEVSIKGSTDDRELGDQYAVSPALQVRLPKRFRLGLEPGYRVKRYEDPLRNATNPYGGVRLTQRVGRGRWDLRYRYEENHADSPRYRYIRSTYGGDVVVPFTPQDTIGLDVRFRPRVYERLVRVAGRRVPLRDLKWSLSPEWVHVLSPRLLLRASYEFEARGANDPGRTYTAHSTSLAVERRW